MFGLIATSSLDRKSVLADARSEVVPTRYGDVLAEVGEFGDDEIVLVRRAGARHPLEPGRINYRAIVLALRELGVASVLSTCVVGSLNPDLGPGTLVSISQFLDFTRHRPPTLFDDGGFSFTDMSEPYCRRLRAAITTAATDAAVSVIENCCYVGVDGPRYETAAEVKMFRAVGGDIVGHTGVTEAIMAREAGLCYASMGLVTNYAAGITSLLVSNDDVSEFRHQHGDVLAALVVQAISAAQARKPEECECGKAPGTMQIPRWSDPVDRFSLNAQEL